MINAKGIDKDESLYATLKVELQGRKVMLHYSF